MLSQIDCKSTRWSQLGWRVIAVALLAIPMLAAADDSGPDGPGLIEDEDLPPSSLPAPGEPTGDGSTSADDHRPPLVIPPAYPHQPQSTAPADVEPIVPESTIRMRPADGTSGVLPLPEHADWTADPRSGLIVLVRESFANQFVQREAQEAGPVRDCILGAQVVGEQMTLAATQLDFVPDGDSARMLIRLSGTVHNRTVGITPQAQVHSRGEHAFRLEKEVDFNGMQFMTRTPAAWVSPRIYHTSAATPASQFPIIGEPLIEPIARMTALSTAEMQRSDAERIAAERVTSQAATAFNDQADGQLATLNRALAAWQAAREQLGIAPEEERVHSTTDVVQYTARYANTTPAQPIPERYHSAPVNGVTLLVNDSLLNAAADDLPIGGREFLIREVEAFIEELLVHVPGFVPSELPANPLIDEDLLTVQLDTVDPIHVAFLEDETHLTFRMSFIPDSGPVVPTKLVTIVYRASITEEWVILTPEEVRVAAAPDAPDPVGMLTEDFIRTQFVQRLVPLQFHNGSTIELPGAPAVRLTVTELSSQDGWLMLSAE